MTHKAVVYTKPDCQPCAATKKSLTQRGVDFKTHDVYVDVQRAEVVKALGYQSLPVTVVLDENDSIVEHWTGYAPSKIEKHFPKNTKEA